MSKVKAILLVLSCIFVSEMASAATLSFNPIASPILVGSTVDIAVAISGLGSGSSPSISTFDLNIGFNVSQLSFASAVFGDPILGNQLDLFGFGFNPSFAGVTGPGVLNIFDLSFDLASDLDAFQANNFTLATLTFNVLSAGTGPLNIAINALGDANGNALSANVNSTSIVSTAPVSAVPLPAAVWFFITGLTALGFLGRKPAL